MQNNKRVYLHIGTHKTGSTSIQKWLSDYESLLIDNGYDLYHGMHKKKNHIELYLATMRYERDSFGKQSMRDVVFDEDYTSEVSQKVREFISRPCNDKKIITTEGLSLLRHEDEVCALKKMIYPEFGNVRIILYLRNKNDFLDSYRMQLKKKKGRKESNEYWSALYVANDTWLIDYQSLVNAYRNMFGENAVKVIDYDSEMEKRGNIIPSFLESIDFDWGAENDESFQFYWINKTLKRKRDRSFWSRLNQKLTRFIR